MVAFTPVSAPSSSESYCSRIAPGVVSGSNRYGVVIRQPLSQPHGQHRTMFRTSDPNVPWLRLRGRYSDAWKSVTRKSSSSPSRSSAGSILNDVG